MPTRDATARIDLGGTSAIVLFIIILIGFVTETQLTQYVQINLEFRQPYLIFYIVHSFFTIMFPIHFLFLVLSSKYQSRALWSGLMYALKTHLTPARGDHTLSDFPTKRVFRLVLLLTAGMTLPSLCWFAAIPLSPVTDVTALWNTNAFFAYVVTVKLMKLDWEPRRLAAVLLATSGAMAVIYGGSTSSDSPEFSHANSDISSDSMKRKPSTALVGNLLTLVAAIVYGVYQVLYKLYAALPTDADSNLDGIEVPVQALYDPIPDAADEATHVVPPLDRGDIVYPPPFGLYPNLLTSAIGICTFCLFWIPIPLIHVFGISTFHLPADLKTVFVILGIALSGVVFNAGFMVLLGVWGPILTSIGSLLTIVLVFLSDIIFGGAVETITIWSVLGCGTIIIAFGILVYDMMGR